MFGSLKASRNTLELISKQIRLA